MRTTSPSHPTSPGRARRARVAGLVSVALTATLLGTSGLATVLVDADRTPPRTAVREPALIPVAAQAALAVKPYERPLESGPRIASFNLLGASHSKNRKGYGGYRKRLQKTKRLMSHHRLSVVGVQEFQYPQRQYFFKITGRRWAVTNPPTGAQPNEILWRRSGWRKIRQGRLVIPYLNDQRKPMPYVLLQRKGNGRKIWFVNVHNPAAVNGSPARNRRNAVRREAKLVAKLRRTGHAVVLMGDFNESERAFCYLAKRGIKSTTGGSWSDSRRPRCQPPGTNRIDWIFGSGGGARFGGDRMDYRTYKRGITDHPVVITSLPRFARN